MHVAYNWYRILKSFNLKIKRQHCTVIYCQTMHTSCSIVSLDSSSLPDHCFHVETRNQHTAGAPRWLFWGYPNVSPWLRNTAHCFFHCFDCLGVYVCVVYGVANCCFANMLFHYDRFILKLHSANMAIARFDLQIIEDTSTNTLNTRFGLKPYVLPQSQTLNTRQQLKRNDLWILTLNC